METFTASLDTTSKIITGFIFLMVVAGVVMIFFQNPWFAGLGVAVIPALLIVFTYIYSISSYQIADDKLVIKRPFSMFDKEISLSDIESVQVPDKNDFSGTIRTAGVGGLFGYYGYFMNNKLGTFRMYATNGKNRILIILKSKKDKIVLSPDDAGMADALQKRLKKEA